MENDRNETPIIDLPKKRREREVKERIEELFDGPEMRRWRQERKQAFEIIKAEVVPIQPREGRRSSTA